MIHGSDLGRRIPLDREVTRLGRDPQCECVVPGEEVSREHCVITSQAGVMRVRDLESRHGTHVNEQPIQPGIESVLRSGDLVRVGRAIFKYLEGDDVEALYREEIYRVTITDALTGTYSRRYLLDFLEREMERCLRHHRPLALAMINVDHFKSINDAHGHLAGDRVLRELAGVLGAQARREGCLSRCGGEEFASVLPETDRDDTLFFAERVRASVQCHDFCVDGERIPVTVSVGIAVLELGMTLPGELIEAAARNLYLAKDAGRNSVVG